MRAWMEVPALKSGTDVTVLMDLEDYEALDGRRISIGSHGYAQIWERPKMLLVHRWIMGVKPGVRYRVVVDHIDRNPLNCRRSNLRIVTATGSNLNRVVKTRDLPKCVYRTPGGRYMAVVTRHYRDHRLGTFDTPEEAAAAVRAAQARFDPKYTALGTARIRCARCGDENGPFARRSEGPVCENCLDKEAER